MFTKIKTVILDFLSNRNNIEHENYLQIEAACKAGNIASFSSLYKEDNPFYTKVHLLNMAACHDHFNMTKYLLEEKRFVDDDKIKDSFNDLLIAVSARNLLNIFRYLNEEYSQYIDLNYNNSAIFKSCVAYKNQDILHYLIVEKLYPIEGDLKEWIKTTFTEKDFQDELLIVIEKQEIYLNLHQNPSHKETNKKLKI